MVGCCSLLTCGYPWAVCDLEVVRLSAYRLTKHSQSDFVQSDLYVLLKDHTHGRLKLTCESYNCARLASIPRVFNLAIQVVVVSLEEGICAGNLIFSTTEQNSLLFY